MLVLADRLQGIGLQPGDTVCLVRLPRASEPPVAAMYAALTACGLRVLLPMYLELENFDSWLRSTNARAVFWSAREVQERVGNDADRARLAQLTSRVEALGIPHYCLFADLQLLELLEADYDASPSADDPRRRRCLAAADPDSECLVLTTSGTSGEVKLVRYRQGAFLRSCQSWEAAGLFRREALGGRGLLLLFGHSIGVRSFWNAMWTGEPVCLITPEWFFEKPERVRALLLPMQPEHIIGGPAAYRALLELARVFPEVKERCLRELRCAVSIGAPFDPELARRLQLALGLQLHNAFGTTETLQVTCTVASESPTGEYLGPPLPGVQIGLERVGGASSLYRTYVSSPFAFAGYLGESDPAEWHPTGDLVEVTEAGLLFAGREGHDFSKDGFGLKLPGERIARSYANLGPPIAHLEFFPLADEPGLGALIFTGDESPDQKSCQRVKALLDDRHERLYLELEDLEFRHRTIDRFACVAGEPPRSTKGTVKRTTAERTHSALIDRLTKRFRKHPSLHRLDRDKFTRAAYERLISPRRGALMRLIGLDKSYIRARGDRLTYRERGRDREVVDFVGGFGGNLLGHRHPELVAAAGQFLAGDEPVLFDQGSVRRRAGVFARDLAQQVGRRTGRSYVVRLGSTGAEAVEMALAHATVEREERVKRLHRDLRRLYGASHPALVAQAIAHNQELLHREPTRLLTLSSAFHGHSLAARSALDTDSEKRAPFAALTALEPISLAADGSDDLDAIVRGQALTLQGITTTDDGATMVPVPFSRIIAALAEPILGEGGIVEVSDDLLRQLGAYVFPLIIDEIQTGLGRTGRFLASSGIDADYYLFGKGLGGGIAKISALLVERSRYIPRFDELYSSTFAEDAFSATVAAEALDLIRRDKVSERARDRGGALWQVLATLRDEFPEVIRAVRGRGLMLGLELATSTLADSLLLRVLAEREVYGAVAAGYLLNVHGLRLLPTLSAPHCLRLEPSAYLDDAAIAQLGRGLRAFCCAVRARDLSELLGFLVADENRIRDEPTTAAALPSWPSEIERPADGATRVAFIAHFVVPESELAMIAPPLAALSTTARRALFGRLAEAMEMKPFVSFARNLFGGRVWFANITLAVDTATMEQLNRVGYRFIETQRIQDAVELGAALGCKAVALGGFTSIISADGTAILPPDGVKVTTGNAFTVAAGVRRFFETCARAGVTPGAPGTCLGIVGASGNIGSAIAMSPAMRALSDARFLLLGRERARLETLRRELVEWFALDDAAAPRIDIDTEMSALRDCDLVLSATSTNDPVIYPEHIAADRTVVIGDLSVPMAVSREVTLMDNVHMVPFTGTVNVPGTPDFVMAAHIAPGTAFCCAAEAMLLGLEPEDTGELRLVGRPEPGAIALLDRLGVKHRFTHGGRGGFRAGEVS